jgi:ATP-dependent exoDNAse (exonuclease V) alpha subunit
MTQADALKVLKTGANVFLTGEPGSGKSHTIREYISYLKSCGIEPAITASTGIAATHIHGMTIHAWSGLGAQSSLSGYQKEALLEKEYLVKRIRGTTTLVIDEISMISAEVFESVSDICKHIRGSELPFGGMQIIVVGDFFQLPPVTRGGSETVFAWKSPLWREAQFLCCYLEEQHRQDDEALQSILSAIRSSSVDTLHIELLQKRMVIDSNHDLSLVTKLYTKNVAVDSVNEQALTKIGSELQRYTVATKGKDALVAGLIKGCLSPEVLDLKVGAVVMCTKNNPRAGYVNGTLGKIVDFQTYTRYPIIETRAGKRITIEPMEWMIEENGKVKASITQIPLRLAWAITVHKSQGMSLDSAVMDLSDVFEYGQGYVALSRIRSQSGLFLLGLNQRALEVHPEVKEQDETFRKDSKALGDYVEKMPTTEMSLMHEQFVKASGGSFEKRGEPKVKVASWKQTADLITKSSTLKSLAKERGLAVGTIIEHLEEGFRQGDVPAEAIEGMCTAKLKKAIPLIHKTFRNLDTDKLAPVAQKLDYLYSYEDLRLARILL